ncbi:MAG: hypothetical protein A4E72_01445 [Syntrophus sp. PtaU1.Bin208]|nr:MAG: hypothetical protein A4E72_01445 [Syntrophus sp. PtaU1.Bin208]
MMDTDPLEAFSRNRSRGMLSVVNSIRDGISLASLSERKSIPVTVSARRFAQPNHSPHDTPGNFGPKRIRKSIECFLCLDVVGQGLTSPENP